MLDYIYIRAEIKNRDLLPRLDLALSFLRKGISVVIGEQVFPEQLLQMSPGKACFFGKCSQPKDVYYLSKYNDAGWIICSMDEEGLVLNNLRELVTLRLSEQSQKLNRHIFFYGPKQKAAFIDHYNRTNGIHTFGSPRVDAWYNNYYGSRDTLVEKVANCHSNYAFFPLNYSWHTSKNLRKLASQESTDPIFKAISIKSKYLFQATAHLIQVLATTYNKNVVIRPHPADNVAEVKSLLAKLLSNHKNVECIYEYDVWPWIKNCDFMVHNSCNTSLEAGFAGKPVYSFIPNQTTLHDDAYENFLFKTISTSDELEDLINPPANHTTNFIDKLTNSRMINMDFLGNSSEKIAEAICSDLIFTTYKTPAFNLKPISKHNVVHSYRKVRAKAGSTKHKVYLSKFPSLSASEVISYLTQISNYRSLALKFTVSQLTPKLVQIDPLKC